MWITLGVISGYYVAKSRILKKIVFSLKSPCALGSHPYNAHPLTRHSSLSKR